MSVRSPPRLRLGVAIDPPFAPSGLTFRFTRTTA